MQAVFGEGVPDAVVCARAGEVVAFLARGLLLVRDDGAVDFVYAVEEGEVGVEVFGDEDAGAGEQDVVPFILEGGELGWA